MRRAVLKMIFMVFAAPVAGIGALVHAADAEREKQVDGMRVYLGVLPSELLGPKSVAPGEHRGVPKGRGYHHVLIALFDLTTGERITDVEVSARVEDVGRTVSNEKRLEAMLIARAVTFGNFFAMPGRDPYSIHVKIDRHRYGVSEVTFHYRHL